MSSTVSPQLRAALTAVFACGVFSAAACASELTVALGSSFTTLDPYDANDTLSQNVAKSFYEGLFGFDASMKPVPVLAAGYAVSADGLNYTVTLREGVRFHDGTVFNAEAVKANFDRVTTPASHLKRYGLYSNIAKTEAVGPYTVKFTLKEPFSAFINQLAHPSAAMVCPSALADGKMLSRRPCGTGPYVLETYSPTSVLKVKKFDGYRIAGLPKLDGITWLPVPESSTRSAMLRTGEAQAAYPVPADQARAMESRGGVRIEASPSIIERIVSFNTLVKPFSDVRVRQALNYAVDKKAFCRVVFKDYADPAAGVMPAAVDYAVSFDPWPYDPKKARELLAEAGYPDGFSTTLWSAFNHSMGSKAVQFIQQQLAQVGVRVKVETLEAGQRVARVESVRSPDEAGVRMYYFGWSASTGEADWALRPVLAEESFPPHLMNTAYYRNPAFDAELQAALRTTDREAKARHYRVAQEIVWQDAPWLFLAVEQNILLRSERLSGFLILPDGGFDFREAELR